MSEKTIITDNFFLSENSEFARKIKKKNINNETDSLLKSLCEAINNLMDSDYLISDDKTLICIPKLRILMPHPESFQMKTLNVFASYNTPDTESRRFNDYMGRCMTYEEWRQIFYNKKEEKPSELGMLFHKQYQIDDYVVKKGNQCISVHYKDFAESLFSSHTLFFNNKQTTFVPVCVLKDTQFNSLLKGNFLLTNLKKEYGRILIENESLVDLISTTGNLSGKISEVKRILKKYAEKSEDIVSPDIIKDFLLSSDKTRADLDVYDENILYDINRGHWELWHEENGTNDAMQRFKLSKPLVGRNPEADIHYNGTIGIDFGTKSTVVVCKNGSENPMPMRIGAGHYSREISKRDYENPTILEFVDLVSFQKAYMSSDGRPFTKWDDLTVSHTAQNQMIGGSSEEINSFFTDLKRWASDEGESVRIKDKNKHEILVYPYESEKNSWDFIEIYAYYLGLYINNMFNGIYINYMISFPVNFSKELRGRLLNSFSNGIKKSLPTAILNSAEIMNKFRITMNISEPAAYAACALSSYGFEPEEDEEVFYGVFDFGGGTTDFDFGVWKSDERYDYCIEHFGAGGDSYLGGEMLLQQSAYEVFKRNISKCRSPLIPFYKPYECQRFAGDELFVVNSQEARMNIRQVAEKLRPIWEKTEDYEKIKDDGEIKVSLFDNTGNMISNIEFEIDVDAIEAFFKKRIERGIDNFMDCLKSVFKNGSSHKYEKINIFLAGNSSLSSIVTEVFSEKINAMELEMRSDNGNASHFELFPPLGFDKTNEKSDNKEYAIKPTGKTGVAFGLIMCRQGGEVKVISRNFDNQGQAAFQFYVGRLRKGKFKSVIDKGSEYGKWYRFIPADEDTVEVYYTTQPSASTQQLDGNNTFLERFFLEETFEEADVYISPIAPNKIKYVVGRGDPDLFEPLSDEHIIQLKEH